MSDEEELEDGNGIYGYVDGRSVILTMYIGSEAKYWVAYDATQLSGLIKMLQERLDEIDTQGSA